MAGPNRIHNSSLQVTRVQKTVGLADLTGLTEGTGVFPIQMARRVLGVFIKSDTAAKIELFLGMPDPENPGVRVDYPWDGECSSKFLLNNDQWALPQGAAVIVKTTGGTNVQAQVLFGLISELF